MSAPKPPRRSRGADDDVISRLQARLDREEVRRRGLMRLALMLTAAALAVAVVAAVLLNGNASAAVREPVVATVPVPAAVETVPAEIVAAEPEPAPIVSEVEKQTPLKPTENPATKVPQSVKKKPSRSPESQRFRIAIGSVGYEPSVIRASASRPVILTVARGEGCAAGFLIPGLKIDKDNSAGPVTVNLGRVPAGRYQFSCGMEMVTGSLIVR